MKRIVQFIRESVNELRKVVWPSRDDVIASTKLVLISTLIMAIVLGLIDFLFVQGIELLFR